MGDLVGWYNASIKFIYFYSNLDSSQARANSYKMIQDRLLELSSNFSNFIMFYAEKFISTWCEPTYQSIWVNEPLDKYEEVEEKIENNKFLISMYSNNGILNNILTKYLDAMQIIIYIMSAIFVFRNRNNIKTNISILAIIFFGGLLFHLMWETKSLYVVMYVVLLLPYVAYQTTEIFANVESKHN